MEDFWFSLTDFPEPCSPVALISCLVIFKNTQCDFFSLQYFKAISDREIQHLPSISIAALLAVHDNKAKTKAFLFLIRKAHNQMPDHAGFIESGKSIETV